MSGIEQPKKKTKTPRGAETYRQNGAQMIAPHGRWRAKPEVFKDGRYNWPKSLNRSARWPRAKSYEHARELSPSSEPVR